MAFGLGYEVLNKLMRQLIFPAWKHSRKNVIGSLEIENYNLLFKSQLSVI